MDPRDLTKIPQWMNWDPKPGKHFKAPLGSIHRGMKSYETALRIDPDHVGFVLKPENGLTCIDLDPENEQDLAESFCIIEDFQSYTEESISPGHVHIWVQGKLPKGKRGMKRNWIELYSASHFMTISWNSFHWPPKEITEQQEELDFLVSYISK